MNLLVTVDDRYITYLQVMLESLFQHNRQKIDVYLLYSDIRRENLERLERFVDSYGNGISAIEVDRNVFRNAPVFRYFSQAMYYRLLCAALLPERLDRVLYMDPDILVRGSLRELYEADLEGCMVGGIADHHINETQSEYRAALGLTEKEVYINSGVLLFDLEKMRVKFSIDSVLKLLEENAKKVKFPDQDVINLYFRGDICFLPRKYNYNTGYGTAKDMLLYIAGRRREKEEPIIVHYMGASKPWQKEYYGKYFFEYYRCYKKYLSLRERLLFLIKPVWVLPKLVCAGCRVLSGKTVD